MISYVISYVYSQKMGRIPTNGSVAFQLAHLSMGPDTVPMALVAYIDGTFMKRGIGIRPIYCEYI